jgi:hypothetical protein
MFLTLRLYEAASIDRSAGHNPGSMGRTVGGLTSECRLLSTPSGQPGMREYVKRRTTSAGLRQATLHLCPLGLGFCVAQLRTDEAGDVNVALSDRNWRSPHRRRRAS